MIRGLLRNIGATALLAVPITLLVGLGNLTNTSINVFGLLVLVLPYIYRLNSRLRHWLAAMPWHSGYYFYSWLWWQLFFFFGSTAIPINIGDAHNWLITLIWAVVLLVVTLIITIWGMAATLFFKRAHKHEWIDTTLDISAYALPVPLLLIGNILYLNVTDPMVALRISRGVFTLLTLLTYFGLFESIVVMLAYLYTRSYNYRRIRLLRILVTVLVWFAINAHMLLGGYIPQWGMYLMALALPMFQASPLVYITPAVFEFIVFGIAVACGMWVERRLITYSKRRQATKR